MNIEDVVAQYVQLKRAGRNFKGLSPFTNEKTPSFMVSPEKQIWHDFSSGRGGNMFGFVMEMEGLDFKGALELLARKAGVELEQFRGQRAGFNAKLKQRVNQALKLAARFYQAQLAANPPAWQYMAKERGFNKQTLLNWQVGYAPNTGRALSDYLTKQGFTVDEMKRAGLAFQRSRGVSDMFRGRIMLPLMDPQGEVVGFTGRLLSDDPEAPKYINTPQTPVYDKSRQVFGLHLAKESIRKAGYVVVVEGNMDVLAAHQAGTAQVVATAGTAMTEQHLKALGRFTTDVRLCFDADSAGLAATERVIPMAQRAGTQLSIITLENAKDPDELIRKDVHLWQAALEFHLPAVDWLLQHYAEQYDLDSVNGKRLFTDKLLATIRRLEDPVEQEHYLKRISQLADTSLEALSLKMRRQTASLDEAPLKRVRSQPVQLDPGVIERNMLQDHLLSITLFKAPLRKLLKPLAIGWFSGEDRQQLARLLKNQPGFKGEPSSSEELLSIADYVKILSLQFEELYESVEAEELATLAERLQRRLVARYVKDQKQVLAKKMDQTSDEAETARLLAEVDRLNKLIKRNS